MIARIVEVLHPEQVWLFGSRARGDAHADSDWDFMAILADDAPEQDLDVASVWQRLRDLRLRRVEVFMAPSTHRPMCTHAISAARAIQRAAPSAHHALATEPCAWCQWPFRPRQACAPTRPRACFGAATSSAAGPAPAEGIRP
jgi:predicted nucleotidyltransferase